MDFVESAAFNVPGNKVVEASLLVISDQELLLRETERRTSSRLIGQACLAASGQQNKHLAASRFKQAYEALQEETKANTSTDAVVQSRMALADLTLNLLRMHNQPTTVERLRGMFHKAVIAELIVLSGGRQSSLGRRTNTTGYLSELITLGLFTRYRHPLMTAWPALAHHDMGSTGSDNYDTLLVACSSEQAKPEGVKLQVKTSCLGFCSEGLGGARKAKAQRRYAEDVVLVSAHCDLGLDGTGPSAQLRTARLLMREVDGTISPSDQRRLDDVSNSLLLSVTDPVAERIGTVALY